LGGVCIESDSKLNVMDRIGINFSLSYLPKIVKFDKYLNNIQVDTNAKTVNITTQIVAVRVENNCIGCRFDNLEPNDFWSLQSFIQHVTA